MGTWKLLQLLRVICAHCACVSKRVGRLTRVLGRPRLRLRQREKRTAGAASGLELSARQLNSPPKWPANAEFLSHPKRVRMLAGSPSSGATRATPPLASNALRA